MSDLQTFLAQGGIAKLRLTMVLCSYERAIPKASGLEAATPPTGKIQAKHVLLWAWPPGILIVSG